MPEPIQVPTTERESIKVTLSEEIPTHSGITSELVFKSPPARAFLKHGSPFLKYTKGEGSNRMTVEEYNWPAVFHFAALSTGVDELILQTVAAGDMYPIAFAVLAAMSPTSRKTTAA